MFRPSTLFPLPSLFLRQSVLFPSPGVTPSPVYGYFRLHQFFRPSKHVAVYGQYAQRGFHGRGPGQS